MSAARAGGLAPRLRSPVSIVLALALLVMAAAYWPEISAAVTVWSTSTAYGHCWLVLPIVAWLLWERRDVVLGWPAHPAIWPVLLTLPLVAIWVLSTWLGVMEGRQLAFVGFAEVLLMAALGWRLWWALSAALLYLLFLVPFGAFVTPQLQHFTAAFIVGGLGVLGVPYDADAFSITIPEGTFYVAEACAGLRFLIASIAFGVLYAVTMFRSPGRRVAFIAVSCVVPVLANGVRGLGIVLLGHVLGSAEAGAADHLIYGWIFFSIVIVLLALAGLPFRQAPAGFAAAPSGRAASPVWLLAACAPVVIVAIATPLAVRMLDVRAQDALLPAFVPVLALPAGCVPDRPARITGPVSVDVYQCGPGRVTVLAARLPHGTNPARIIGLARQNALAALGTDIDSEPWQGPAGPWTMLTARDTRRAAAYAVWVDGVQRIGGLHDRLTMARDMFRAGPDTPVAVSVTMSPGTEDGLRAFLTEAHLHIAAPNR
jgi:exosortase A